ncbi:MAG TPA: O-antigen ligase family protein [Solirubrobacteraceae bacterium]|jgi:tetratricopeptide (TPR) repeat protein|nr:O-antigen ligase family protein [Solirubrobacteraceae bacterium]
MSTADRSTNSAPLRLVESLRQAPTTVPALVAVAGMVVWASDQAGYPLTHWAPGGLLALALLGIAAAAVPLRFAEMPGAVRVALLCLAGYVALSYLSILWAGVPGDAWEGANRTLLYLLVFMLFALWRQRGASAALLLGAWTLALIALAAFAALHVDHGSIASLLPDGRLVYPTGYPNANAAQWLMAFWPAVLLARGEQLWWGLRGVLAGGAVLLAGMALLSQSRGSLFAMPIVAVLVFVLLPGRVRTFALLVPVALGVGAIAPIVLRVGNRLHAGHSATGALHEATTAMFAAALAVGVVVAVGALVESRHTLSPTAGSRLRQGAQALAVLTLVAVLAGGWAAAGNPVTRLEDGWHSFKGGYSSGNHSGSRLVSGLGSNRYDFYRVALNEFKAHPLLGIGADNYAQQYLRHGRSRETPHYPHSVELRTLAQTGVVGGVLALVGLAAALLAALSAVGKGSDPLGRYVAAAALAGFGYWAVHGSVDWFWEFAGLGAPAWALLGLACALAPRRRSEGQTLSAHGGRPPQAPPARRRGVGGRPWQAPPAGRRRGMIAVVLALALLAAVSFAAPWLSQLEVQSAARVWPVSPEKAYSRLHDAAALNPLSDAPYLVAGSIALRLGETRRADEEFARALRRVPDDAYATLERGAIASTAGRRGQALVLLQRAAELNPRDALTRQALALARAGQRVDVAELNRSILHEAQQLS